MTDPPGRRAMNSRRLAAEVVLHRCVEVEVVLRQVGEDRGREVDRVGAVELECVRGDLHRAGAVAPVEHLPERALQVDRLRGGPLTSRSAPPITLVTVPSRPVWRPAASSSARTRKAVVVLPLVPVMPTVWSVRGRIAVEARRRPGPSPSGVGTGSPGRPAPAGARRPARPLRAPRLGGEVVTVAGEAGHAEEQRAGLDAAVVVGEPVISRSRAAAARRSSPRGGASGPSAKAGVAGWAGLWGGVAPRGP